MNSSNINSRFLVLAGIVLVAAMTRLLPHPPNFTAIGAIALFGGAYFEKKAFAFIVPMAAMLISDLIIGFHPGMYAVYTAFALIVIIGLQLKENKKIMSVFLASICASVSFFIITNFALWVTGNLYPKTGLGLAECFTAAIPFFQYTFLGDLFFAGVMFGSFEIAKAKFPELSRVRA